MESPYLCDRFASLLLKIYVNSNKSPLTIFNIKRPLATLWQRFMVAFVQSWSAFILGRVDSPSCHKCHNRSGNHANQYIHYWIYCSVVRSWGFSEGYVPGDMLLSSITYSIYQMWHWNKQLQRRYTCWKIHWTTSLPYILFCLVKLTHLNNWNHS